MKYRVLSAYFREELEKLVEGFLRDGWSLAGGVSAVSGAAGQMAGEILYLQAMTKPGGVERC